MAAREMAARVRGRSVAWGMIGVGAAWLCTLTPRVAEAQNNAIVTAGRDQYDNLRYEEAIQTLSAALIRSGNTPAQEAQIEEYLGLSYLALGRTDEAEGAFRLILQREPDHALDADLAPRVLDFFAGVRQRWIAEGRPGATALSTAQQVTEATVIEHRSPPTQPRGEPLDLVANLLDPGHRAAGLVLAWRTGSRGLFHRLSARGEGETYSVRIPGADVVPPVLEYYLEAVSTSGIAVAARGDAFAPLRVMIPAERPAPVYTRWWFWTGAVVVLSAVVVGTYFAVHGSSTDNQPGRLTINVTGD